MSHRIQLVALGLLLAMVAAACGGGVSTPTTTSTSPVSEITESPTPTPVSEPTQPPVPPEERGTVGTLAPELAGISGWLKTEPITLKGLRGKVVLIDFWTYTCVNCIRTFPYLKEWYDKYTDEGLVIIGVHSPEFEFEKKQENVATAMARYGLQWPTAQDNDFETWQAYNNRVWPTKYLIDKEGIIRYSHFGEGAYAETEEKIRELLAEIGAPVSDITANEEAEPQVDPLATAQDRTGQTRELYAGFLPNSRAEIPYFANTQYDSIPPGAVANYQDPGNYKNHFLYLQGVWLNDVEDLRHGRQTENLQDYIALKFYGISANVVINFEGGDPFKVVITLDGMPLVDTDRGADIRVDEEGMTFLWIDEPRMYNMVQLPVYGGHELKLSSNSDRFSVFAFTFGSYAQGP